jgi:hypothetical protein
MRSAAVAVRLGVRSRRPAGQARCPSWTAVRAGVRVGVRPSVRECQSRLPVVPGRCRKNSMSGRWRSARRRLAPTPDRGRLSAATSRSWSRPSRTHLQRVYHGHLGTFLHSGESKRFISRVCVGRDCGGSARCLEWARGRTSAASGNVCPVHDLANPAVAIVALPWSEVAFCQKEGGRSRRPAVRRGRTWPATAARTAPPGALAGAASC